MKENIDEHFQSVEQNILDNYDKSLYYPYVCDLSRGLAVSLIYSSIPCPRWWRLRSLAILQNRLKTKRSCVSIQVGFAGCGNIARRWGNLSRSDALARWLTNTREFSRGLPIPMEVLNQIEAYEKELDQWDADVQMQDELTAIPEDSLVRCLSTVIIIWALAWKSRGRLTND